MDKLLKNPWFSLFCIAVAVRTISVFGLYFLDTPFGDKIADNWRRFLPHTLVFEVGLIAAWVVLFRLLVHGLKFQEAKSKLLSTILLYVLCVGLGIHIILAQMDSEVMRWLGQHLNIVWLKTYVSNPDISMMLRIYADDLIGITFAVSCILLAIGPTLYVVILRPEPRQLTYRGTLLLLVIAVAGLTSKNWFDQSKMRWRKIQPATVGLFLDLTETQVHWGPERAEKDLNTFNSLLYPSKKIDSDIETPFYKLVDPTSSPLQDGLTNKNRPNIVLIIMESIQGWSFDLRDSLVQQTLPNITALFKERGEFFPKCFSTGYPSVEGFSSVHLGVLTPPDGIFLTNFASIKTRAIPEILRERGGYSSQILTGAEPSFANLYHSFRKWYDQHEYDPKKTDDLSLANWLVETHRTNRKTPHLLTWMTASTALSRS
jgi:phosphoglycerol transferase MdoB-like AlkP superfamily enzyme